MVSFKLNWFIFNLSEILQLREFVFGMFNHFLLIDETNMSIRIVAINVAYTPFHFSRTLPLNMIKIISSRIISGKLNYFSALLICVFKKTSRPCHKHWLSIFRKKRFYPYLVPGFLIFPYLNIQGFKVFKRLNKILKSLTYFRIIF